MRYMMTLFTVSLILLWQNLFATPKADSILTFTEGARAKFVWKRWAWCNDDYTPKTEAKARADGYSLILFDTDEGTERTLVAGLRDCHMIRITRSGRWVTYIDSNATYIVDLITTSPVKKKLMGKGDCTYWAVHAMWIDPATGTDYLFCLDNTYYPHPGKTDMAGNGIWKVKLNNNGTADLSTATKLNIIGLRKDIPWAIDESFSVSADGKKLGGAFPWPDTYILDIPTGNLDLRHNGAYGCQANLAPDNSYRFYHCLDDHTGLRMFAANMSTQNWAVSLLTNLAGLPSSARTDFNAPRWTNHVRYFTATWPMDYNPYCGAPDCHMQDNGSLWLKSATWVKTQINMQRVQKFYLGKFSADFRSQEKSILIACDPRYFQHGGDAWICNGTTYGNSCASAAESAAIARSNRTFELSVMQNGTIMNIRAEGETIVCITDVQGRLIRRATCNGTIGLDTPDLAIGAYVVAAHHKGRQLTKNTTIVK